MKGRITDSWAVCLGKIHVEKLTVLTDQYGWPWTWEWGSGKTRPWRLTHGSKHQHQEISSNCLCYMKVKFQLNFTKCTAEYLPSTHLTVVLFGSEWNARLTIGPTDMKLGTNIYRYLAHRMNSDNYGDLMSSSGQNSKLSNIFISD